MSGFAWWAWLTICVAGWYAAAWLLAWWADDSDELAEYRHPPFDDAPGPPWPIDEYLIDEADL